MMNRMDVKTDQIAFKDEAVPIGQLVSKRGFGALDKAIQNSPYFNWVISNPEALTSEHLSSLAANLSNMGLAGKKLFDGILASARPGHEQESRALFDEAAKAKKRVTYEALSAQGYPLRGEAPQSNPVDETLRVRRELELTERGFVPNAKNLPILNHDFFVTYLFTRAVIVECGGAYYIYDSAGFFREISARKIKKLARIVLHEVWPNLWDRKLGEEIMEAFSLQVPQFPGMDVRRDTVNLTNLTLNPLTGETMGHSPAHLSTVQLGFAYDADAQCPTFDKFLNDIMLDDRELIMLVQEIMGYLLTCDVRMQKAFFFYGEGSNGKSVLAEVIRHLCGLRNVSNTPLKRLEGRFGMQNLPDKMVNISTENELNGREISTEAFKSIVGGDAVDIERKFMGSHSTKLFVRLVVLMNTLPHTRDLSHGYFRRIQFVPFRRTFRECEADKVLLEKLLTELPGILNFALEGLHRLATNDYTLTEARAAREVHAAYQEDQNPFLDFCRDALVPDSKFAISRADMQKVFSTWCVANGLNDWAGLQSQRFWALFRTAAARSGLVLDDKKVRGVRHVAGVRVTFDMPDNNMILDL
ncbi:DNA primase family protein [Alicyclobacillus sp. ALC3]|uniref:DNA primase family protein n=1 Tax=Alicyclobacillus sp. ALC3 TaxID=2796143 RepID=UPI002378F337|nr:phage/plasmid primase, P4 family [Alicyclobacillus sp. ALC3]WDL99193.1 hypothetical protein JC200_11430 [Alicyclobacillus sp. ALC3]